MLRKHNFITLLLFLSFCMVSTADSFEISKKEQVWLDAHTNIRVGIVVGIPPYSRLGKDGKSDGIDPEIVKLLNKMIPAKFSIVPGTLEEMNTKVRNKKIDVLMCSTSAKSCPNFNYTRSYVTFPHVIVAKEDGPHFGSLSILSNKTVALEKDSYLISYLNKNYPTVKVIEYSDSITALKAVNNNHVEAYIGSKHRVNYLLSTYMLKGIGIHTENNEIPRRSKIAVRKDWPVLMSLLDRALEAIPHNKFHDIIKRFEITNKQPNVNKKIDLTESEKIWIKNHPNISVGAETDWPPYDFVANGKAAGFSNDYMRLLAKKAGLNIKFVHGFPWDNLLEKAKQKEIDIMPCISKNRSREKYFNFTPSYLTNTESLVVHQDATGIKSLKDMAGKSLARIKGYSSNKTIHEKYPKIKFVYVNSPVEGLTAVSEGRADGFMEYMAVINYLRREHLIQNLRIVSTTALPEQFPIHMAVRKDWPILCRILEKAMTTVAQDEYNTLKKRWFATDQMDLNQFQLTPAEKEWLSKIGPLRVGIANNLPPFQYVENDTAKGMALEYTKIIKNRFGIELNIETGSWQSLMEQAKAGKIDILTLLNKTRKRSEFLTFTKPFLRNPMVIATGMKAPFYTHYTSLKNIKIGLGEGHGIQEKLKIDYPEIKPTGYGNIETAMLALNSGKISALVINSAMFNYYKNKLGLQRSLHINNTIPYEEILTIGVRHELSPLVTLLNRVLAGISPEEHKLILDKWTDLPVHRSTDWGMVWRVALALITLLLFTLFWSRKMTLEVKRRKKAEQSLIQDAVELKRISEERDRILNMSMDLICIVSMDGYLKYASPSFEKLFGYTMEELFSQPLIDFIHPDDRMRTSEIVYNLETVKDVNNLKNKCICKDGSLLTISWITTPLVDEDAIYCTGRDITDRIQSEKAVKESEKKYKAIFDSSGDSIAIIDFDTGSYIDCNKASLNLFNLESREQFISNTPAQLSPEFQVNGEPSHELAKRYIEESFNQKYLTFEWIHSRGDGTDFDTFVTLSSLVVDGKKLVMAIVRDITDSKNAEKEREKMIDELQEALESIKTLSGLVPICSNCKKIRDDEGYWNVLESYIEKHSNASFSHGICAECSDELYGKEDWYIEMKKSEE